MNWLGLCETQLDEKLLKVLRAFGRKPISVKSHTLFELLEEALLLDENQSGEIIRILNDEVDLAQSKMFARRYIDCLALLEGLSHRNAKFLGMGLRLRMREVLRDEGPWALRVRALVDFYYSHGAVLRHSGDQYLSPAAAVSKIEWSFLADGVEHGSLTENTTIGPIRLNILRVSEPRILAVDARPFPQRTLQDWTRELGYSAGVSGGFFLYSESEITPPCLRGDPVGLLVSDSKIISPPFYSRAALIQRDSGLMDIKKIGLKGCRIFNSEQSLEISAVNAQSSGVVAWTRAQGRTVPRGEGTLLFCVSVSCREMGVNEPIPTHGAALRLPLGMRFQPGLIQWELPEEEDPIIEAMAGGPFLIHPEEDLMNLGNEDFKNMAPPITFSNDETFDQNLLPRMAAGLDQKGRLFFLAVDGRDFHQAPGLNLQSTASILRALGCVKSLNLDGGSSKRMVVNGKQVDRSSTEIVKSSSEAVRLRPIRSAVLVMGQYSSPQT